MTTHPDVGNTAESVMYSTRVNGDKFSRIQILANGNILRGNGTSVPTGDVINSAYTPYGLSIGVGACTVPIGLRAHAAFDNPIALGVGVTGGQTFRTFHPLTDSKATTVLPVFGNYLSQAGSSSGDVNSANLITIAAAIECSDGSIIPFTFKGSHTFTFTPGTSGFIIPDTPLSFGAQVSTTDKFGVTIPLTGVWIRTWVSTSLTSRTDSAGTTNLSPTVTDVSITAADSGMLVTGTGIPNNSYVGTVSVGVSFTLVTYPGSSTTVNATATGSPSITITATLPTNLGTYANSDNLTTYGASNDLTTPGSSAVGGGSGTNFYGPLLLLGKALTRKPIVACLSDSILDGYGDDFHSTFFGPVARACVNLSLPFVKLSRGGETALALSTSFGRRYRQNFVEGCTHAIISYGTNDGVLNGAAGVTTLQTRLTAISTWLTSQNIKTYLCTVPPRTTSTDTWATVGNQTPVSGSQPLFLGQLNDWIRTVPTGFSGIYDMADDVMSSRNSGLWTPGSTTDGVHPSDTLGRGLITTNIQTLLSTFVYSN